MPCWQKSYVTVITSNKDNNGDPAVYYRAGRCGPTAPVSVRPILVTISKKFYEYKNSTCS